MSTKIQWVHNKDGSQGVTWNPVVGCSKVSEGCLHCYAEKMAIRLASMSEGRHDIGTYSKYHSVIGADGGWNGTICIDYKKLGDPLHWRKSRTIFVCSMGDLFHEEVPMKTILMIFDIMHQCPQHTFIVLTKRPHRMLEFCQKYGLMPGPLGFTGSGETWPDNVWAMVTAENQASADERIPLLLQIPAKIKGISIEPMLGPIDLTSKYDEYSFLIDHLDWVIMGAESGHNARLMKLEWAKDILTQCQWARVPLFYKQGPDFLGQWCKMPILDGQKWSQMPEVKPLVMNKFFQA